MNDFEYDSYLKKKTAQGAKHKRGKRKGCRLPTDNMTNRQIEKLHGEVYSVNINEPITWDEFTRLTDNLKREYYNAVSERFCVGQNKMSLELFGKSQHALAMHLKNRGITVNRVVGTQTAEQKIAWKEFIGGEKPAETPVEKPIEKPVEKPAETEKSYLDASMITSVLNASFTFANVQDFMEVARTIQHLIPAGATVTITAGVGL